MNTKTLSEFNMLVNQYSHDIFTYLWRMTRDPQDAEDILQETFLRAFQAFPRLNNDANLRAWLYKIATNNAFTYLKRRYRRTSQITKLTEFIPIVTHENHEGRDLLEVVLQAVEQLPNKQQAALMLRNFQGLTYDEIAAVLGCSPESARANVYQALKKMRDQFEKEKI